MFNQFTQSGVTSGQIPPPREIRALLLDDSSFDRARIRRMSNSLHMPITLDEVGSIEEMDAAVEEADYDLIMIDYRLPVGNGFVALDHLSQNLRNQRAGKIMITGNESMETAVGAMRAGCHDFLCKDDMNVDVLRRAILNTMAVVPVDPQPLLGLQEQRDMIREGVIAAFQDADVQDNVATLLRSQAQVGKKMDIRQDRSQQDWDGLLNGLTGSDEFIFH